MNFSFKRVRTPLGPPTQMRAVGIEQLSSGFSSFSLRQKQETARKTGNNSKVWKFYRGQNICNDSHSNIWKKMEKMNITKIVRKKICEFAQTSSDQNAPKNAAKNGPKERAI